MSSDLTITNYCSFITAYINNNPSYVGLVDLANPRFAPPVVTTISTAVDKQQPVVEMVLAFRRG